MLAGDKERLEDHLIHLLSERAGSSAESLCKALSARYRPYTVQAVYKELRKLQAEGVVVKARGLYSLRLTWIFAATDLIDRAYSSYVDAPFPDDFLPQPKKKITWRFFDLKRADEFYMQLMTKLVIGSDSKVSYTVIDHPWYLFIAPRNEAKYQKILKQQTRRHYIISENNTALDRFQLQHYDKNTLPTAYFPEYGLTKKSSVVTFVGEYILSEKLDPAMKQAFDTLYKKSRSPKEVDHESIIRLFMSRSLTSVTIEHQEVKSKGWARKLKEIF